MVQFRKSKKVGPLRFTLSQRGLSVGGGAGPLRVSRGADGRWRRTVRIPGAGVYDTKMIGGQGPAAPPGQPGMYPLPAATPPRRASRNTKIGLGVAAGFIAMIAFGAITTGGHHSPRPAVPPETTVAATPPPRADATDLYLASVRTDTDLTLTDTQALQAGQLACSTLRGSVNGGASFGRARDTANQAVANLLSRGFGVAVPGIVNVNAIVAAAETQLC